MVKEVTRFLTNDGKEFGSKSEAEAHEAEVRRKAQDYYQKFFNTYSGRRLLEKHSLSEYGLWRVRGADSNADFGGHHHRPDLGLYEGKLDDVIRTAVNLPGFWSWGGGGNIDKVQIEKPIKV